ncbi:MAG: flagellin, partial [Synergistaceae bacterium]|nr:flagellin [Synergistaceae bacterium]
MRILHNIAALFSYDTLSVNSARLQESIRRLASGLRVVSAADDAAGLAISEKMRSQIRGLDRASLNSQDGVSLLQTADGALSEVHSILQRMRELSIQAANDVLTSQDRSYIQLEIDQLKEEIDRISKTTQFNRKKLLDGTTAVLWSSDRLSTEVAVREALPANAEGNYRIEITADPGAGQVLKSHIFEVGETTIETTEIMVEAEGPLE